MTENERIRELRKHLNLTLVKFGEAIGVTNQAVSAIESGKSAVTDRTRLAIVNAFGASEIWLRTGDGEMFPEKTRRDELQDFFAQLSQAPDGDFRASLVSVLSRLDPAEWSALESITRRLIDAHKTENAPDD